MSKYQVWIIGSKTSEKVLEGIYHTEAQSCFHRIIKAGENACVLLGRDLTEESKPFFVLEHSDEYHGRLQHKKKQFTEALN